MEKIASDDPETCSADIIAENIQQLSVLFPEAFVERKVDFEVLRQLLGDELDDRGEKYGLSWHGKRRARQLALTPSTGTLRPCLEESLDWDTTRNLMIEGDNLEVIKLLQKSYSGKVKLIYIDPPYNTGKDFVYLDDYQDSIRNYLELTSQVDGESRMLSSNSETLGRFHTNWLNMMYPRLKLARNLLNAHGVMIISIDDGELAGLRMVCDEIFGEECFAATIAWKKRSTPPNDRVVGAQHDYLLIYTKNPDQGLRLRRRSPEQLAKYKNPDNHPKGPWAPGDLMANVKGGRYVKSLYFPIVNPRTGEEFYPSSQGNWRFNREKIQRLLDNNEIYFGMDDKGRPKLKRFLCDIKEGITWTTLWDFVPLNTDGSKEMAEIFGNMAVFENPKPVGLLQHVIHLGGSKEGIVLDFFAGSGTTGAAVMMENVASGQSMRYIMVQLPEECGEESQAARNGFQTLSDVCKERLRRVAKKLEDEYPDFNGDLGFRTFELDSSNVRAWAPDQDNLSETLLDNIDHIVLGRSEEDILYELILKLGLDLCVPIETHTILGKTVYSIGAGTLLACLDESITRDNVESLALGITELHSKLATVGDTMVFFRDSAFEDDVAKTNCTAILQQYGLSNIRSL
ncbi:MAG: site-specific DNA-methyltransferase [Caldilineaceae bacterium]|nr:site-specific DNA-methyltransferase [Caldilineaceae bacterium]